MKRLGVALVGCFLFGCGEPPVEPTNEVKNGPKLSASEAEKFRNILPGSRKSQKALVQSRS